VELVESFVGAIGSLIHCSGGSKLEIKRRTAFIRDRESMFALDQNIWGSEIWCLTSTLEKKIDALDNWCLRCILHIHWTDFVSDDVVRSCTYGTTAPVLSFFGYLCRADVGQDHSRALRACIRGPPKDCMVTKNWKTEANLAENG